ncbi:hypothetical protein D3C72_2057610 [compost metagenome]
MAELPGQVRGYGPVKDKYLAVARASLAQLRKEWSAGGEKASSSMIAVVQV